MLAKTNTWHANAFSAATVFNPKYKLTGNEHELQDRWSARGMKIGFVTRSFVFHYRSVSRPDMLSAPNSRGAVRNARISSNDGLQAPTDR